MATHRISRVPLHERASQSGELAAIVLGRREQLGLRQDELADLADCSPRFVHELEHGKPTVQLDKLVAVLHALGLGLVVTAEAASRVRADDNLRTRLRISGEAEQ